MTVIITRPEPDASAFALMLENDGIPYIQSPVMEICYEEVTPDMEGVTAIAFTSANGVRGLINALPGFNSPNSYANPGQVSPAPHHKTHNILALPVFAIGPATAAVAKENGFSTVHVAEGDGISLAALLSKHFSKQASAQTPGQSRTQPTPLIYHAAGSIRQGDLVKRLGAAKINARREVLYRALPVARISHQARRLFKAPKDSHKDSHIVVTFFSPRTARLFVEQIKKEGLLHRLSNAHCVCLSTAIADILEKSHWKSIQIAAKPNVNAIRDLLTPYLSD